MHHAVGFAALVAAIAFAFGQNAARVFVGTTLLAGAGFILFVLTVTISRGHF